MNLIILMIFAVFSLIAGLCLGLWLALRQLDKLTPPQTDDSKNKIQPILKVKSISDLTFTCYTYALPIAICHFLMTYGDKKVMGIISVDISLFDLKSKSDHPKLFVESFRIADRNITLTKEDRMYIKDVFYDNLPLQRDLIVDAYEKLSTRKLIKIHEESNQSKAFGTKKLVLS